MRWLFSSLKYNWLHYGFDTGIGIEPEHQPNLFDRTDDARSRDSGGTGLGLAIVKQYVLSNGGPIDVKSTVYEGIRFVIQLPY